MFDQLRKHKRQLYIGLIIVFYIAFCIWFFQNKMKIVSNSSLVAEVDNMEDCDSTVGEIMKDTKITQTFHTVEDIQGFTLSFATWGRLNTVEVIVQLMNNSTGETIYESVIDASVMEDNAYQGFLLDTPAPAGEYTLVITSPEGKTGNAVTLWCTTSSHYEGGTLYVNGEEKAGDLGFKVFTETAMPIYIAMVIGGVILGLLIICVLIYYVKFRGFATDKMFLFLVIPLGIMYMVVFGPYDIENEALHMNTAYYYSDLLTGRQAQKTGEGFNSDSVAVRMEVRNEDIALEGSQLAFNYYEVYKGMEKVTKEEKEYTAIDTYIHNNKIAPVIYLPSILGITLARLLGVNGILLIYFGRILNFAVFVALCYFGIQKASHCRLLLFMVSMLPMTVHQAVSLSSDGILYGMVILFIGLCLSYILEDCSLDYRQLIPLAVLSVFIAAGHDLYFFLPLLAFMIPKHRFNDKKQYWLGMAEVAGSGFLAFLILKAGKMISIAGSTVHWFAEETAGFSFSFLLLHPIRFVEMILGTLEENGSQFLESIIGTDTLIHMQVPYLVMIAFVILLVISSLKRQDVPMYFDRKRRLYILGVLMAVSGFIFAFGLLAYTPAASTVIMGVQGYYFIPVLPLLLLLLRNKTVVLTNIVNKSVITICALLHLLVLANSFVKIVTLAVL